MERFGALIPDMREMNPEEIFLLRLDLLIVMVKAYLKGYPVGEYRKAAVLENAAQLHRLASGPDPVRFTVSSSSHLLKQRVKLLSIMASAMMSDDCSLGVHRRDAVYENIKTLCEQAFPKKQFKLFPDIMKVA